MFLHFKDKGTGSEFPCAAHRQEVDIIVTKPVIYTEMGEERLACNSLQEKGEGGFHILCMWLIGEVG